MKENIKLITVFCEGPHDVAFLIKILKTTGFKLYESVGIKDYEYPYNEIILQAARKSNIEQLNITEIRRVLLPSNILRKNETYLFLYSMEGDGRSDVRKRMIAELSNIIPEIGEISGSLKPNVGLAIVYFFDADAKGIDKRMEEVIKEVQLPIGKKYLNGFVEQVKNQFYIGAYIFANENENTGKLEDIIIPLMKENNEPIFDDANVYLDKHFNDKRAKKKDYDPKKSVISIAGQLQKSGKANTVCITDTDYITEDKIKSSSKCQEIIAFFDSI